jgi:hypothetical protein
MHIMFFLYKVLQVLYDIILEHRKEVSKLNNSSPNNFLRNWLSSHA